MRSYLSNRASHYPASSSRYDMGVLLGMFLVILLGGLSIFLSGDSLRFFNVSGICIVFGGCLAACLIQFSSLEIQQSLQDARKVLYRRPNPLQERARVIVALSRATKDSGLVFLDREAQKVRDPFFRLGLELAVDRQPEQEIRRMLEIEQEAGAERAYRSIRILESTAQYAPAMGLIGTLVGLVQLLGNISNPTMVGPAMSIALLTTLYGAVFANLVLLPIAGKLTQYAQQEYQTKTLTIEGVISLAREENPVILEQRLKSFMPNWMRQAA